MQIADQPELARGSRAVANNDSRAVAIMLNNDALAESRELRAEVCSVPLARRVELLAALRGAARAALSRRTAPRVALDAQLLASSH